MLDPTTVGRRLMKLEDELGARLFDRTPSGYVLTDAGHRLLPRAERIERETEVPVKMSNVPLEAVVLGAGHVIEHYDALKGMFMGARR